MTKQFNALKAIATFASGTMKVYGLPKGQGLDRRNDMARTTMVTNLLLLKYFPWGAVWSESTLFAQAYLVRNKLANTSNAAPWDHKTNKMACKPSKDRSAWASTQSDQSLRCHPLENFGP